ncbi:unnamed protein product, partial [Urochloa humidicola]
LSLCEHRRSAPSICDAPSRGLRGRRAETARRRPTTSDGAWVLRPRGLADARRAGPVGGNVAAAAPSSGVCDAAAAAAPSVSYVLADTAAFRAQGGVRQRPAVMTMRRLRSRCAAATGRVFVQRRLHVCGGRGAVLVSVQRWRRACGGRGASMQRRPAGRSTSTPPAPRRSLYLRVLLRFDC